MLAYEKLFGGKPTQYHCLVLMFGVKEHLNKHMLSPAKVQAGGLSQHWIPGQCEFSLVQSISSNCQDWCMGICTFSLDFPTHGPVTKLIMKVRPIKLQATKFLIKTQGFVWKIIFQGFAHLTLAEEAFVPEPEDVFPSQLVYLVECGIPRRHMAALQCVQSPPKMVQYQK